MILVLTMVVVASIMGMSYLSIASVKLAGSTNMVRASQAMYLAESGIQHALWLLRSDSADLASATQASPLGPFQLDSDGGQYRLYVEPTGTPLQYAVVSQGTAMGITRTSRAMARIYSEYRDKVMALGPIHYWRLGELSGGDALNECGPRTGNLNDPQLGQPGAICGDLDRAVYFDGMNDYVGLGKMDVPGSAMTVLCWFKADDYNLQDLRFVSKARGLAADDHYWMLGTVLSGGDPVLRMRLRTGESTATLNATSGTLDTGTWTMAAATFDGNWMKLYKNSQSVGIGLKFGFIAQDDHVLAWIGGNPDQETDRPFHGTIDEVAMFSRALTPAEIKRIYEARIALVEIVSWEK